MRETQIYTNMQAFDYKTLNGDADYAKIASRVGQRQPGANAPSEQKQMSGSLNQRRCPGAFDDNEQ